MTRSGHRASSVWFRPAPSPWTVTSWPARSSAFTANDARLLVVLDDQDAHGPDRKRLGVCRGLHRIRRRCPFTTNAVSDRLLAVADMPTPTLQHFELHVLLAMLHEQGETYSVPLVLALERRTGRSVAQAAVFIALKRLETQGARQLAAR